MKPGKDHVHRKMPTYGAPVFWHSLLILMWRARVSLPASTVSKKNTALPALTPLCCPTRLSNLPRARRSTKCGGLQRERLEARLRQVIAGRLRLALSNATGYALDDLDGGDDDDDDDGDGVDSGERDGTDSKRVLGDVTPSEKKSDRANVDRCLDEV